jgi:hypothetical protein
VFDVVYLANRLSWIQARSLSKQTATCKRCRRDEQAADRRGEFTFATTAVHLPKIKRSPLTLVKISRSIPFCQFELQSTAVETPRSNRIGLGATVSAK